MDRINNYTTSFSGINKDTRTPMLSKEEQIPLLIEKGTGILTQRAEREVPENGKFQRIFVAFDIPESRNEAILSIETDAINPKDSRRISIGVHHQNSDRLVSNYMFKGTKQEVLDYLQNKDNYTEFVKTVNNLSNTVDNYYSSL